MHAGVEEADRGCDLPAQNCTDENPTEVALWSISVSDGG